MSTSGPRTVVSKLQATSESSSGHTKTQILPRSDVVRLEVRGLKICISNKCPGSPDAVGPGMTLYNI